MKSNYINNPPLMFKMLQVMIMNDELNMNMTKRRWFPEGMSVREYCSDDCEMVMCLKAFVASLD